MKIINIVDEKYITWVDMKPAGDLTHVSFYSQFLDAKDPNRLEKKFEMFLPKHSIQKLIDELK